MEAHTCPEAFVAPITRQSSGAVPVAFALLAGTRHALRLAKEPNDVLLAAVVVHHRVADVVLTGVALILLVRRLRDLVEQIGHAVLGSATARLEPLARRAVEADLADVP
eukprot:CAMPEP_0115869946 /NCGR_PEP_ID=MMETSP0287-20121206/22069_1 /TAXON_ID=412157 /ORGANISM="Chrysochromulina rotalis, Strain UIO044" /LENGTH=108 /DNA_ID=CAMNT_0003324645 /DNA_START=171 /DNA_END=498 /DNA_ORIENTATION=-